MVWGARLLAGSAEGLTALDWVALDWVERGAETSGPQNCSTTAAASTTPSRMTTTKFVPLGSLVAVFPLEVFLIPEGVMSKAQARMMATGNPSTSNTTKVRNTQSGAPKVLIANSASCAISHATRPYAIVTLNTLRRFNSLIKDKGWLLCVHCCR